MRNNKNINYQEYFLIRDIDIGIDNIRNVMGDYRTFDLIKDINKEEQPDVQCTESILPDLKENEQELDDNIELKRKLFAVYDCPEENNDLRISVIMCIAYFRPVINKIEYRLKRVYTIFVGKKDIVIIKGNYKQLVRRNDDMPFGREAYGYAYYGKKLLHRNEYASISNDVKYFQTENEIYNIVSKSNANGTDLIDFLKGKNGVCEIGNIRNIVQFCLNPYIKTIMEYPAVLNAVLSGKIKCGRHGEKGELFGLPKDFISNIENAESPANFINTMKTLYENDDGLKYLNEEEVSYLYNVLTSHKIGINDFVYVAKRENVPYVELADQIKTTTISEKYTKAQWIYTRAELLRMTEI